MSIEIYVLGVLLMVDGVSDKKATPPQKKRFVFDRIP